MDEEACREQRTGEDRKYWIALNQVSGISPERFYQLVEHFKDPEFLWTAPDRDLERCVLLTPAILKALKELRKKEDGAAEIERAGAASAEIVTLLDDGYPKMLKESPFPPPVLYIKGELDPGDEWAVAIVGSRTCTGYGRDTAFELARRLAGLGFTIVSGLAKGIDAAAHAGALKAGGRTIAVFGTDIDTVYPPAHRKLAEQILESGALASEFPIGAKPDKWNFPRRNAVISGMSRGTIVVEAAERSGALITARLADEQGREMFAVPGDINTSTSKGPHWLIKHGAHLVESADDVVDIIGSPKGQEELKFEAEPVGEVQAEILTIVSEGPARFDEICAALKKQSGEVASALMMLEMRGIIRQLPGKIYVKSQ